MKAALGFFLGVLCACSTFAQGTIHFANTVTTRLSTNSTASPPPGQVPNATGFTSGLNHYRIGLYIAPQGTTDENAFTLIATATNFTGASAGLFDGGQASVPGNTGQTIAFQVRAWTLAAGLTFEQAAGAPGFPYLGKSTIGFVAPGPGSSEIFGSLPGQVGGFVLTPVPEPSTYGLVLLGLALGVLAHRRPTRRERH